MKVFSARPFASNTGNFPSSVAFRQAHSPSPPHSSSPSCRSTPQPFHIPRQKLHTFSKTVDILPAVRKQSARKQNPRRKKKRNLSHQFHSILLHIFPANIRTSPVRLAASDTIARPLSASNITPNPKRVAAKEASAFHSGESQPRNRLCAAYPCGRSAKHPFRRLLRTAPIRARFPRPFPVFPPPPYLPDRISPAAHNTPHRQHTGQGFSIHVNPFSPYLALKNQSNREAIHPYTPYLSLHRATLSSCRSRNSRTPNASPIHTAFAAIRTYRPQHDTNYHTSGELRFSVIACLLSGTPSGAAEQTLTIWTSLPTYLSCTKAQTNRVAVCPHTPQLPLHGETLSSHKSRNGCSKSATSAVARGQKRNRITRRFIRTLHTCRCTGNAIASQKEGT